ncbi:MAG: hydrogenase maturation factor [Butyrivibrio sp.]|nr:hydrogenase maturation factor [Butyrivibrio sp.]
MKIGKISENALKRSVLKQIKTEYKKETSAAVGTDCAFSDSEKLYSAVCPVTENIEHAGYYAVMKAICNLVIHGITPSHVTVSILLPQETEEKQLKAIVRDAIDACNEYGVVYSGGHTEVTGAVTRPVITANCVGIAEKGGFDIGKNKKLKAGQALVITKWIGLEGTAMIAAQKQEELSTKYPVPFIRDAIDFRSFMNIAKEAAVAMKSGAVAVTDISNGGVYASLWDMAERAGTGLSVDLKSIPIRQETVEICEFYELNPYRLLSGGSLLYACEDGEKLVDELAKEGIPASVVGYLKDGNDKIITNADESRFLEKPECDQVHKILG